MKFTKLIRFTAVAALSVGVLAACAPSSGSDNDNEKTLKVGVMTFTDATEELWDQVEENLEKEGIELDFVEFTDYSQPNKALANGEIDVNAFQHYNFLNNWNKESNGDLVAAGDTLISPLRIFSGLDGEKVKYTDISQIPDGGVISVPNDATNESRALYLLESAGLIKLDVSGEELATIVNIVENPKNLDIKELDASQTASTRTSVDAAIINNNYAVDADVDYATVLFKEEITPESHQWVNLIAAQKDWEKSDKADLIKALVKAYQTDNVAQALKDTSNGIDIAAWEGAPSAE
ncbi:MetQ/NlpA family ABC transporter substrate-binding protein [Streptococcus cameli]